MHRPGRGQLYLFIYFYVSSSDAAAGRQYPFKAELICLNRTEIINGNYILINCLAISKLLPPPPIEIKY